MDHVQRRLALGMTIGLGQITLHHQSVLVLHQRVAHEAQHRTRAEESLVKARIRIGGRLALPPVHQPHGHRRRELLEPLHLFRTPRMDRQKARHFGEDWQECCG